MLEGRTSNPYFPKRMTLGFPTCVSKVRGSKEAKGRKGKEDDGEGDPAGDCAGSTRGEDKGIGRKRDGI